MLIDMYCTDKINIVSYSKDLNGVSTRSVTENISCFISDKNKIVTDQNGKEVVGNSYIALSPTDDLKVNYGDKIQIVEKGNFTYPNAEKEFLIKNIGRPRGFSSDPGYIGIWI